MQSETYIEKELTNALKILRKGGIILYPTDTIWGIGCDATNEQAVNKIIELKKRPENRSMLILVDDAGRIPNYVKEVPEVAWQILEVAVEPITLIFQKAKNLAKNLINIDGSIGIRVVKHEFTTELVKKFNLPIVSTSANISGEVFPKSFKDISDEIKNSVDYIVRWKTNEKTTIKPSSIIKIGLKGEFEIIRQ